MGADRGRWTGATGERGQNGRWWLGAAQPGYEVDVAAANSECVPHTYPAYLTPTPHLPHTYLTYLTPTLPGKLQALRCGGSASRVLEEPQPTLLPQSYMPNRVQPLDRGQRAAVQQTSARVAQLAEVVEVKEGQYHVVLDPTFSDPIIWVAKVTWVGDWGEKATLLTDGPTNKEAFSPIEYDETNARGHVEVHWLAPHMDTHETAEEQRKWLLLPAAERTKLHAPFTRRKYLLASMARCGYKRSMVQACCIGPIVSVHSVGGGKRKETKTMKLTQEGAKAYSLALENFALRGAKLGGQSAIALGGMKGQASSSNSSSDSSSNSDSDSDSEHNSSSGSNSTSDSDSSTSSDSSSRGQFNVTELAGTEARTEAEAEAESAPAPAQPAPVPKRPRRVQLARRSKRGALAGAR